MAISATGLGSGLDIKSLVDQLVAAERQPVATRLAAQEAKANAQLTALGRLKSALSGFKSAAEGLADIDQFQKRVATSADEERLRATASTAAEPASYAVEILALARAHRLVSAPYPSSGSIVGEGQLTISSGANSMQIEVTSANSTLAGIRDAINASQNNPGVRASIVTGADGAHLILTATRTGAANAITVDAVAPGSALEALEYGAGTTNSLTELAAAADASVEIDGLPLTSASNSIEGAIDGVTLELLQEEPGTTVAVDVAYDEDSAKAAVAKFVDAYNAVSTTIAELTAYNAETKSAAVLLGDAATRSIKSGLREILSRTVGGAGDPFRTLAEIGITTGSNGRLSLDAAKLDAAIGVDFDAVGRLFASDAGGIASQLADFAESFLASEGRLGARETTLKARLEDISDQRTALDARIEAVRKRYQNQFNALDLLVGQLNQTSSFLTQQLANL